MYMPEIFNAAEQAKKDKTVSTNKVSDSSVKKSKSVDDYSSILRQEKPKNTYLDAFLPKPPKVCFESQLNDEEIVMVLRQHPITLVKKVAIILLAIFFPLLAAIYPITDFFPASYQFAMTLGWYALTMGFALETFLTWFFSVYIITDERIIDVDFISLLFKDISSAKIDSIEDISSKTGGILATVVDYGTVYIQTAAENPEIQFENIPQPAKVAAILNELLEEEEKEKLEGRVR